jgi:hypothetical protein
MARRKKYDKRLNAFRTMPPLTHKPGETFDPNESEVFDWIKGQPDLLNYLMDTAKDKKLISFKDGKWSGVPAEGSGE